MYNNGKQQTHCICNDMAFAAFDHFATIKTPAFAAQSGCLNRLAINTSQTEAVSKQNLGRSFFFALYVFFGAIGLPKPDSD
jgi:hypothetical protein